MHTLLRLSLFLVFLTAAFAQNFSIVKAEYGANNTWIDVTERVRQLVRGNGVELRVDGDTLSDPLPGVQKTLRIRYVFRNRTQTENFRDLDNVRLGNPNAGGANEGFNDANNGNIRGGGRGALNILSARYGVGNRWTDVTQILNSNIRNGALRLTVNAASMNGDPAPANVKVLEVEYGYRGRNERVVVRENEVLDLPNTSGMNGGNNSVAQPLVIETARYGGAGRYSDVTELLRRSVQNDTLNLVVNRSTMGGDPAPRNAKLLEITFTYAGRRDTISVRDGDTLVLPRGGGNFGSNNRPGAGSIFGGNSDPNALYIESATWGLGNRSADVTQQISTMVRDNRLSVRATNSALTVADPAVNADKELYIRYRIGNTPAREVRVREGRYANIP